jgi:hypothetical protein
MLRLACIASLFGVFASGCIVVHDNPNPNPVPTCNLPTNARSSAQYPVFHIVPNGSSAIPVGDIGYLITANGQGAYRLVWIDTLNSPACFSGILSTTGTFDASQTRKYSGQETISASAANEIRFASVPGSTLQGIDVTPSTDPLYVDAYIDGNPVAVNIYYSRIPGTAESANADPAAFTSP